jgi:hypothetical protein
MGLAAAALYFTGRWAMAILALCLLLSASWPMWLPVRYELGPKGIIRGVFGWRRRISWTEFGSYQTLAHGVLLCPRANTMPLATVRGLFLPSRSPHADLVPVLDHYLRASDVDANQASSDSKRLTQ